MARGLKLRRGIALSTVCSKNKGADQLLGCQVADLRLRVFVYAKSRFSYEATHIMISNNDMTYRLSNDTNDSRKNLSRCGFVFQNQTEVKRMQRSGTEAIRTQIQPSKPTTCGIKSRKIISGQTGRTDPS